MLTKAYVMLTSLSGKNQTAENFVETVIRKLVKVGMKEDIDELVSEGATLIPRDLDDIMDELEDTYKTRRKEPEIKLAFMLYGIDEVDLPPSATGVGRATAPSTAGTSEVEGKVSYRARDRS